MTFKIGDDHETILVDDETLNKEFVEKSINKKVGEPLFVQIGELDQELKKVEITRIANKFLNLFDELLLSIGSQFNELPFQSFKIDENDVYGSINEQLFKLYGAQKLLDKEHQKSQISEYKSYKTSFTDIVRSLFNDCYITAYSELTSNSSLGFYIRPNYINNAPFVSNSEENNYILDFSAIVLFSDLDQNKIISFQNRQFITTSHVIGHLDRLISKANNERNVRVSLSFSDDYNIRRHFYDEAFHQRRIDKLKFYKRWTEKYCKVIIPNEKLKFRSIFEKESYDVFIERIIENVILSERENYYLISDDIVYTKHFNKLILSTEEFLKLNFKSDYGNIITFLLNNQYMGLTLDGEILYNAYISKLVNKDMSYDRACDNINLMGKFGYDIREIYINFLKRLAISPSLSHELYSREASFIFLNLLVNSNRVFNESLAEKVHTEFNLLGQYYTLTTKALSFAVDIFSRK
ncbi:hypothetical protein [Flammeovirga sp. SJP92]|uniref:PIN domain-containing protein n=1 Tax=Flammeovirga sp. SJP92 TaxID=1775430 RepID=UPI0007877ED8|nr:hypothetical protein [Flammeovirga sp. SJP92]KXX71505.1 hypothetical protein AVL50_06285 [Flammeovirga sp. SJP92]